MTVGGRGFDTVACSHLLNRLVYGVPTYQRGGCAGMTGKTLSGLSLRGDQGAGQGVDGGEGVPELVAQASYGDGLPGYIARLQIGG